MNMFIPDSKVSQGSPHREDGWLTKDQTVFLGELPCSVSSLLPEVGSHSRRVVVDDAETGVQKEPIRTCQTVSDLPHLHAQDCVRMVNLYSAKPFFSCSVKQ